MTQYTQSKRIAYLDILRIIAVVLVIFNHTGSNGFQFFVQARGTFFYPVSLFISFFDKIAVPLFFMISGVLLIPKEESYKEVLKRFIKFAAILFCVSVIMFIYRYLKKDTMLFTFGEFFTALYSKGIILQYWYLYAYLAYILMLPFIRKLAKGMEEKDFIWLLILFTLSTLLHILDYTVFKGKYLHNDHFDLFIGINYVFYPLLGYYLEYKIPTERYNKKTLIILAVSSVIALSAMVFMAYIRCSALQSWTEEDIPFFNCFVFLPAMTVFVVSKMWFMKHPAKPRGEKVLSAIAGTTFGLYLFEQIFRTELKFILEAMMKIIHPYIASWLWVLLVCIVGGCVVFLIRLIPGVKRVL